MKNSDRIRKMTDEELACFLVKVKALLYRDDLDIVAYQGGEVRDALDWLNKQAY